ncbi:MAG TPA: polysaccharide deacetylase family protein [Acidimicrobiia bacterium]|nr:polysaccharide deacetylase family protein [Acidimicrobiia bacterium]
MRQLAGRLRRRALASIARSRDTVDPGCVALTYDDGPDPAVTPRLLDVLHRCGAPATFFVVGERAAAHADLVRRIVDDGHSIGTHSMHHRDLRRAPVAVARAELDDGRRAVESIVGRPVPLFRPPHGHLSARSALLLRPGRWQTWLWTTDGYDWKPEATCDSVVELAARVGDGGIVLLHDTSESTVGAAGLLVDRLRARGLELVAL